jgi:Tfp pilus assembly ATPase PilU
MAVAAGIALSLAPSRAQAQAAAKPQNNKERAAQQSQSWSGILVDADCKTGNVADKCEIVEATRSFGFQTSDGKYFKLDSGSNAKVKTALQASETKTGSIRASLSGTMDGDNLKVDAVEIERRR